MKRSFRYQSIFTYGSLQSVGHTEEYFAKHTRKLIIYIVMPRLKNRGNFIRVYRQGRLVKEEPIWSSSNFFFYYLFWLWHYWKFILVYFERKEKFVVLSGHPISFFGMTVQKLLRPQIKFAFWIGDYYPPVKLSLRIYEAIKKYYHDRIPICYYLSDVINCTMNDGVIAATDRQKTVMWGVKVPDVFNKPTPSKRFTILFVGLIKEGQGIETLFSFLSGHREYFLNIIGVCQDDLFRHYQKIIKKLGIGYQVFFPNTFYSESELQKLAKSCHVGIALYDLGPSNVTYYTDPGKVKTYAELGLPIIMTDTSGIIPYIRRFGCGKVIHLGKKELECTLSKIRESYVQYQKGLTNFVRYFSFETYYKNAFVALEQHSVSA